MARSNKTPQFSLIIPVYNEYTRLISGVVSALGYLRTQKKSWELIIVDDGSDVPVAELLTQSMARKILKQNLATLPIRVVRLVKNSGKGRALKKGILAAKGKYLLYSDVDFSVPAVFLGQLLAKLNTHPVVIGSRRLPHSEIVVHQSPFRELSGRIFTMLSNILCQTSVADATCGFKGFQRRAGRRLFGKSRISRWVYDTEVLFLARKWGIPVHEMPVAWTNKIGSKVRPLDTIGSLIDLIRIRVYDLVGKYDS